MKRQNLLTAFLLFFLSFIFFARLFLPQLSLFFTPDLGRSDVFHYNLAKKFLLSQALKDGKLPLWTDKIGTGVSLIGEGQIGSYNLFNLILFYLFPLVPAFNLSYVLFTALALFGVFALARFLKFSRFAALLAAFVFAFSGFFIFHLTHSNIFAASSFLPWIFLFALKVFSLRRLIDILLLTLFLSQQIFIGHIQITFITLIGLILFLVFFSIENKSFANKPLRGILLVLLATCFGILLASIHLFPLIELKNLSVRNKGLSFEQATSNSLNPKMLLTFIYPFIFGNPVNATYPLYKTGNWDIFWEKIGFLGPLPLIFAGLGLFSKKIRSDKYCKSFCLLLISATFLSLGKYSPLFFLYFLPPFNFFQVPARFIILMIFSLSLLGAYGAEEFFRKIKDRVDEAGIISLKIGLLLLTVFLAWQIAFFYHPIVPAEIIQEKPESAVFLENKLGRIYQTGAGWPYLQELLNNGWQEIDYYLFANNSLDANANILYGMPQVNIYDSVLTQRQEEVQSVLQSEAVADVDNLTATASAVHKKFLSLTNSRFLISPFKFIDPSLPLVKTVLPAKQNWQPFYIYENLNVLPRARLVNKYQVAKNLKESSQLMRLDDFNPQTTVILENNLQEKFAALNRQEVVFLKDTSEKLLIETNAESKAVLVLADSYYPGWQASIDGKKTEIHPANINQRAIIVPEGKHKIQLVYAPKSFKLGALISGFSFIIWFLLLITNLGVELKKKKHEAI